MKGLPIEFKSFMWVQKGTDIGIKSRERVNFIMFLMQN